MANVYVTSIIQGQKYGQYLLLQSLCQISLSSFILMGYIGNITRR